MRKNPVFIGFFIAVLSLAFAPRAQAGRLYFAGYLGLNSFTESSFTESSTPAKGDFKFKNALSYAGALGLRLSPRWRLEGELSYRAANLDHMSFANGGSFEAGGEIKTKMLLLNVYRDFDVSFRNLEPFVTAGAGLAWHDGLIDDVSGLAVDATDTALGFAWQAGGGVRYRLGAGSVFTTSYRYVDTTDVEFDNYEFGFGSHEFRLGLEYDIPVDLFK